MLALDTTPSDSAGEGRPASVRGDVEFRSVHFAYVGRPDAAVLRGLSLRVPTGSSVALVGASGSGKSTAVALLLRLYEPTSGACQAGIVPGVLLHNHHSVRRNLVLKTIRVHCCVRRWLVMTRGPLLRTTIATMLASSGAARCLHRVLQTE